MAQVADLREIVTEVRPGGLRDAVLFSMQANATHGYRRSSADKRRSVETLLPPHRHQVAGDFDVPSDQVTTVSFDGPQQMRELAPGRSLRAVDPSGTLALVYGEPLGRPGPAGPTLLLQLIRISDGAVLARLPVRPLDSSIRHGDWLGQYFLTWDVNEHPLAPRLTVLEVVPGQIAVAGSLTLEWPELRAREQPRTPSLGGERGAAATSAIGSAQLLDETGTRVGLWLYFGPPRGIQYVECSFPARRCLANPAVRPIPDPATNAFRGATTFIEYDTGSARGHVPRLCSRPIATRSLRHNQ
ncbi:MAG: hypothetical protein HY329_18750 [Chloroflexi bacterium]|nr:hypothetical protein [Chloroflexota bacterium]